MKIVSLLPSATEIVYALGLGDSLEAVTYECDYPPQAQQKPVVSETALPTDRPLSSEEMDAEVRARMDAKEPLYKLDKALIQRIQPDLIVTQDLCRVCAVPSGDVQEALAELGSSAQVVSLDPKTLPEIFDGIEEVGRATGTQARAKELVGGLKERVEAVKMAAVRLPTIRTFAMEWLSPVFVGGHWIPEMVQLAGGENLLNEPGERSRTVTWREVANAQPEVVVFMPCGYYLEDAEDEAARLYRQPEFQETIAHSSQALYAVDATSFFSRPGPRIVDGLEILAWAIHPDAYPEPPPGSVTRIRAS